MHDPGEVRLRHGRCEAVEQSQDTGGGGGDVQEAGAKGNADHENSAPDPEPCVTQALDRVRRTRRSAFVGTPEVGARMLIQGSATHLCGGACSNRVPTANLRT